MLVWQVVSGQWSVEMLATKRDDRSPQSSRDHGRISEETARARRIWRMLRVEEFELRLFGNSDSERLGGRCSRGGIAPGSASESVVPVDRDEPAVAHGGVMQRCLDMSNIMVMSVGPLTQLAACFSGQRPNHR
jgi:hypothetical protein